MLIKAIVGLVVVFLMFRNISWKFLVGAGVAVVTAGVAALYKFQDRLLYFPQMPTREYVATPDISMAIAGSPFNAVYEDVHLVAKDGVKLHAWLVRHPSRPQNAVTVLFFHGNAGSMENFVSSARVTCG
jgi:hypothetical protein